MGMAIVCSPYTKRKQGNRGFLDNLGGWLDPDYDGLESYNEAVNQWESYNRSGSQEALTEASRLFREAAEKGHPQAQYYLGSLIEAGLEGGEVSEADNWLKRAADNGCSDSMYKLALKYTDGRLPFNTEKAEEYLKKASEAGHDLARLELGRFYWNNNQAESSFYHWEKVFKESETPGMAACLMGQAYNCGHGVPKSQDEAFEYWSYSPESDPSGITYYNLGLCYMNGTGTSVDYDSALDHFLEAENRGYACGSAILDCERAREASLLPPVEYYAFAQQVLLNTLEKMEHKPRSKAEDE